MSDETPSVRPPANFAEALQQLPGAAHPAFSVTNILIAANIFVFLVMTGFLGAGVVDVTDLTPYIRYGANNGAATSDGEWWRLITSMFLHFGILHLAFNMWALYQTGQLVERLLGRTFFTLTYFASGIGGGFLSLLWHGDKLWSAGASGAIFGIYGAILGFMLRDKHALPRAVFQPLLKSTLTFAGYNLVLGAIHSGIDNAAHIGGLAAGILFGWLCAMPLDPTARLKLEGKRLAWASLAFVAMVCYGISVVPRYPYVVSDELIWHKATKNFVQQESDYLTRENMALQRWQQRGENGAALAELIESELVPFYANFEKTITSLPLTPGRQTDRRRQYLTEFVSKKQEGYRHLLRAVRENSQTEMGLFNQSEADAVKIIHALQQLPK